MVLRIVVPFVRLSMEVFHDCLKVRPFLRLQREEFQTDSPVAAPAHDRLPDREQHLIILSVDAEGERRSRKDLDGACDAAASEREIEDGALSLHQVDRTEGTVETDGKTRVPSLVHGHVVVVID